MVISQNEYARSINAFWNKRHDSVNAYLKQQLQVNSLSIHMN